MLPAFAQIDWDRGGGTDDWQTATNWSGDTLPNAGQLTRISNNGPVVLGSGSATVDVLLIIGDEQLTVSGGAALTGSSLGVGFGSGGVMTITGAGTEVFFSTGTSARDVVVGSTNAVGSLTIESGALLRTAASTDQFTLGSGTGSGTINLNSNGVLATGNIERGSGGQVNFNGGIFRSLASSTNLFEGFVAGEVQLLAGGGTIDTNGFNATASNIISGTGDLTKTGSGTLTLSGANTYAGGTTINAGTLQVGNGGTTGSLLSFA